MSDFKYCLVKYGALSSEEEKKLRSVFQKLLKYDPVLHPLVKAPEDLGDYDMLCLDVNPGFFGGDSDGLKYFSSKKWDNFVVVYVYESRKNVDFIVNAQFKVRKLPLGFTSKDDFIGHILDTNNADSEVILKEPQTPAPNKSVESVAVLAKPKLSVVEEKVVAPTVTPNDQLMKSLNKLSDEYSKTVGESTTLKVKVSQLESEVSKLQSEKSSLQSKVELLSKVEQELSKLKQEKKSLDLKLPELESYAKSFELEKQRTSALVLQVADHATVKSELQRLKDEYSQKVVLLEKQVELTKRTLLEREELQVTLNAQQAEVKKLAAIFGKLKEEKAVCDIEHSKTKQLESSRVVDIVSLRSENVRLKSELDQLKEQLKQSKKSLVDLNAEHSQLQIKMANLSENLNKLQKPAELGPAAVVASDSKDKTSGEAPIKRGSESEAEQKGSTDVSEKSGSELQSVKPQPEPAPVATEASAPGLEDASVQKESKENPVPQSDFKLKDLPYEKLIADLKQEGNKIVVKYLNIKTLEREENIFSLTVNPRDNANILRQACAFRKQKDDECKKELSR
jgi:DNA repair exonuclease SbcCD ATPase subunit